MKCSTCNEEIAEDSAFCPKCGESSNGNNKPANNFSHEKGQQINVVVNQQQGDMAGVRKSRVVYIILAFFFGALGIHNFYAHRTGCAIAQLLITLLLGWINFLTFFIFPGIVPLFIWVVIEMIAVSKDGFGRPMS